MRIHIVRQGEAFEELVQKYNVPFDRLLEANPSVENYENLEPGSKIRIPTGKVPVSIPNTVKNEALVEELFLEPVGESDPDISWEYEDDWEEEAIAEDNYAASGPYPPVYPMEPVYPPYFSISHFQPPVMPYAPYPPYPPMTPYYPSPSDMKKKESSSTVY